MCVEIEMLQQPGNVAGTLRGVDSAITACSGLWRVANLTYSSSAGARYRFAETLTYTKSGCAQQGNGVVHLTSTGTDSVLWEWAQTGTSSNQATATLTRRSSCP
jgi:hypothetical protein